MPPPVRRVALAVHLTVSVGWVGAVLAYVALGTAAVTSAEGATVRAAWVAMELIGWFVLVPLAVATLVTGVTMSLGTTWGLLRYYWVVVSLGLTTAATAVLLFHLPDVSALADQARAAPDPATAALGGDLFHAGSGLAVLLVILALNVVKPRGLTAYGWRRRHR